MKAAEILALDPALGEVFSEAEIANFLNGMNPRMTHVQVLAKVRMYAANTKPTKTAAPVVKPAEEMMFVEEVENVPIEVFDALKTPVVKVVEPEEEEEEGSEVEEDDFDPGYYDQ